MKKRRLILLGVALVTLILLLVAVVLLVLEVRNLGRVKEARDRAQSQLDRHYASKPFPASDNVDTVLANAEQLREWRQKLIADISKGQVLPDTSKTPAAFINDLSSARIRMARAGGPSVVDEEFAFGFDRYFMATAVPPDRAAVPRLVQQLRMIEAVIGILFDADINRLTSVKRDAFEVSGREGGNPDAGLIQDDDLFARFHFTFEFNALETALTEVLNRLAALQPLAVVTQVQIEKRAPDIVLPSPDDVADSPASLDTDAVATNKIALPRDARVVSGIETAKPFSVSLELDIYWFREGEEQ